MVMVMVTVAAAAIVMVVVIFAAVVNPMAKPRLYPNPNRNPMAKLRCYCHPINSQNFGLIQTLNVPLNLPLGVRGAT